MLCRELIAFYPQIHTKHINTLFKGETSRVSQFVSLDVRDFDHGRYSILIPLFRPFISGFNESG